MRPETGPASALLPEPATTASAMSAQPQRQQEQQQQAHEPATASATREAAASPAVTAPAAACASRDIGARHQHQHQHWHRHQHGKQLLEPPPDVPLPSDMDLATALMFGPMLSPCDGGGDVAASGVGGSRAISSCGDVVGGGGEGGEEQGGAVAVGLGPDQQAELAVGGGGEGADGARVLLAGAPAGISEPALTFSKQMRGK